MKHNTFLISLLIFLSFFTKDIYTQTIAVMPFVSKDELWDKELKASDGVARLLTESLIRTKMFSVPDFDLLVAYFGAEAIVIPYRELATNVDIATRFSKYAFSSDYIVMGNVLDFSVIISNKNEIANVNFDISLIDVNTKKVIKNISSKKTLTLPKSGFYTNYTADDAIFTDTILGKATVMALNDMASQIGKALQTKVSKGYIVRIENDMYFIDIGASHGISLGDEFDIYDTHKILIKDINITNSPVTNKPSNRPTITNSNNTNPYSYVPIRTNENGDIWFTSERLYEYRIYEDTETYLTTASVVEVHNKYSILKITGKNNAKIVNTGKEGENDKPVALLMVARLVYAKKPEDNAN